jgi:hypothetical protein
MEPGVYVLDISFAAPTVLEKRCILWPQIFLSRTLRATDTEANDLAPVTVWCLTL